MQRFQPPQSLERRVPARAHQALFSDNFDYSHIACI